MEVRETNRRDMEARLQKMGDFVKMDYLLSSLKKHLDFDTRRFVLLKLAELYAARRMFLDAARMMQSAAPINTTNKAKAADFISSGELFIRGGGFDMADSAFDKALACVTDPEKIDIKRKRVSAYKERAEEFLKNDKRQNALIAYERLMGLGLDEHEKREVQGRLLELYNRLGKVREYINLKRTIA